MDIFEHKLVGKVKNIYCSICRLEGEGGSGITISMLSVFGIEKVRAFNGMILLLILFSNMEAGTLSFIVSI